MVYNPYQTFPTLTQAPDQSFFQTPQSRNPFFFSQSGQAPAPYYNPFQGAHTSGIPVHPPKEEEVVEEVVKKAVAQAVQEGNDNPSPQEIAAKARKELNKPIYGGISNKNSLLSAIGDYVKGGGVIGMILKGLTGDKQKINPATGKPYPPMSGIHGSTQYASSPEHAAAVEDNFARITQNIGVRPTGNTGYNPGDYSQTTGGVFNKFGVAVDPETGNAVHTGTGSQAYASFADWQRVLSAGSATGWRGGILSDSQISQLSDVGRENYQNFQNALEDRLASEQEDNAPPPSNGGGDYGQDHDFGYSSTDQEVEDLVGDEDE